MFLHFGFTLQAKYKDFIFFIVILLAIYFFIQD